MIIPPALHLASLTPEELFILLKNLRNVFAGGDSTKYLVDDSALKSFLDHCNKTIGNAYFTTPRNTIKAFIDLLSVLEQNPQLDWQNLIEDTTIAIETPSDIDDGPLNSDDELVSFKL